MTNQKDILTRLRAQLDRNMLAMARELQRDPDADQREWSAHMAELAHIISRTETEMSRSEQPNAQKRNTDCYAVTLCYAQVLRSASRNN